MTDKEKFRKEVEKLKSNLIYGACSSQIAMETMCKEEAYNEVLAILDTMQEEPVSKVWHDMSEESENGRNIIIIDPKDFYGAVLRKGGSQLKSHNKERYVKWAYIDDIINITNKEEPVSEDLEEAAVEAFKQIVDSDRNNFLEIFKAGAKWGKEQTEIQIKIQSMALPNECPKEGFVSEDLEKAAKQYEEDAVFYAGRNISDFFKAGAKWQKQKDESTTEDLGEYINELSKQFPEVSFAKLSRIAVRAAKWQKEQMMAKAIDGDITFDYYGDDDKIYGCIAHNSFCLEDFGLKDRDKVKVIVIKED